MHRLRLRSFGDRVKNVLPASGPLGRSQRGKRSLRMMKRTLEEALGFSRGEKIEVTTEDDASMEVIALRPCKRLPYCNFHCAHIGGGRFITVKMIQRRNFASEGEAYFKDPSKDQVNNVEGWTWKQILVKSE